MNRDVFLWLLALDSYNRGYGQNVRLYDDQSPIGQNELGLRIGNAVISSQNISEAARAAGFYAIAYNWNGETIISLSGTKSVH